MLAVPRRGAAPPAAALPPFTAVAPGPIPAELHPGSSLQSPQASHCLGLVSEQSLRYFFCSPSDGEQGKGKEKTSPCSPCHITACPSLPIQCIRSFIVIRPNKSFADGCRSFCPETFRPPSPRFSVQSPFSQSRKHQTVPETSSPIWCTTGRASRAWTVQL